VPLDAITAAERCSTPRASDLYEGFPSVLFHIRNYCDRSGLPR
jgi:hypothetical protein